MQFNLKLNAFFNNCSTARLTPFRLFIAVLLLGLVSLSLYAIFIAGPSVDQLLLTWRSEDTSHTMSVVYFSDGVEAASEGEEATRVLYDTVSHQGDITRYRFQQNSSSDPFAEVDRTIHTADLTQLQPATLYYFVVANGEQALSQEMKFRTLPDDDRPIRIAAGGDMGIKRMARAVSRAVAKTDPDLVIIGGDIAYADGEIEEADRWDEWLDQWSETMITSDGRLIPLIAAIGNHETNQLKEVPISIRAPFFIRYLNQDAVHGSYFSRRLGANTGLLVLDSSHYHLANGPQKEWLEAELKRYQPLRYRLAVYHRPLYPGGRYAHTEPGPADDLVTAWLALFDQYRLTVALENHYHVFKRSHQLFNNQLATDQRGTLYLGDGAWGKSPREALSELWYVAVANQNNHAWILDISTTSINYRAIDQNGEVFDHGVLESL